VDALRSRGPTGPAPKVSDAQLGQVEQALLAGEQWTLERVAVVVERLIGVRHHPAHGWARLRHRLGRTALPPACHLAYQVLAAWRETPKALATSAWLAPQANIRAACMRRSWRPAKSRRQDPTLMGLAGAWRVRVLIASNLPASSAAINRFRRPPGSGSVAGLLDPGTGRRRPV
jgi:hypothetical protein